MASSLAGAPLLDRVADVVLLVDRGGSVLAANARAREVLGRDPAGLALDEVFGKTGADLVWQALPRAQSEILDLEAPLSTVSGQAGYLWLMSSSEGEPVAMCGREIDRIYGLDLIQRLSEDIQDRQGRLEVVSQINRALARTLDLERIGQVVASKASALIPMDFLQIAVAGAQAELCDCKVLTADQCLSAEARPWVGLPAERCFRSRRPAIYRDGQGLGAKLAALGAQSAVDVPIVLDDQVLGVLTFASREPASYQSSDVLAVEPVAAQYAIALANARVVRGLQETNRIKQEVIEIASHEFNTPLTVIKGFASLLSEGLTSLPPQQASEAIRMIDAEAERLRLLVDELLTVSRIDAGRIDLYLSDVDLALLVKDCSRGLEMAFPKRVVRLNLPPSAPVSQDDNKISRCLINLLSNALKFSPKDTDVEVELVQCEGFWEIRVFNVDEGFTPEEIAQLFEKFRRLDRHKNHSEGSGLGLYVTRRLAQRLGGDVCVQSEMGRGTTFVLKIPDLASRELLVPAAEP